MPNCCAFNCTNRFSKGSGISFHRFPLNNKERLQLWINATHRKNFVPNIHTSICSVHFTDDCFYANSPGKRMLKEDATPSRFDFPVHLKKKTVQRQSVRSYISTDVQAASSSISTADNVHVKRHFLKKEALPTKFLPKIVDGNIEHIWSRNTEKIYSEGSDDEESPSDSESGPIKMYKSKFNKENRDALLKHSEVVSAIKTLYQFLSTLDYVDVRYIRALRELEDLARDSGDYAETVEMFFKSEKNRDQKLINVDYLLGGKENFEMVALLIHSEVISALKTFHQFLAECEHTKLSHIHALREIENLVSQDEDHTETLRLFFEPDFDITY